MLYKGYTVHKSGIIISPNGTILKQRLHKGYLHVIIGTHKVPVHRIVATCYVPNPEGYAENHHKDGDKLNNHADNLMWVSRAQHIELHKKDLSVKSKLNWEAVKYIREHIDDSTNDLAEMFGVSPTAISLVKHNKTWKKERAPSTKS